MRGGTYYESVIVTKPISLVGQGPETTEINGGLQAAISISADNALVTGFTLFSPSPQSHGYTVHVECKNSILRNNIVRAGTGPPYIVNRGVSVVNSTNITIENNRFEDIQENAVLLGWGSSNNIVRDNVMTNVYWGVGIWGSPNNIIEGNTVTKTYWGYEEMQYHEGFPPVAGISIWESAGNEVTGNTVVNNSVIGISLVGSIDNSIIANIVSSNGNERR